MTEHEIIVRRLKNRMLDVSYANQKGFMPSSFSILDILVVLFYRIMNDEDVFVLSKGHAAFGLYAVLEDMGRLAPAELSTLGRYGSRLSLMADGNRISEIRFSTGSLGLGLSEAVGIAYARRLKQKDGRVYVIVGDGEINEGSVWEAFITISNLSLTNLVCIIDHNRSSDIWEGARCSLDEMLPRCFHIIHADGHDEIELHRVLRTATMDKPIIVVAETVKGKGFKAMEENPQLWHSMAPDEEQHMCFKGELNG